MRTILYECIGRPAQRFARTPADALRLLMRTTSVGWERVEKLEKILHAEDAARAQADSARATAISVISEARAKAEEIVRTGREEIRASVQARRDAILEQARTDAATLAAEASIAADALMESAETRTEDATKTVLEALKGL